MIIGINEKHEILFRASGVAEQAITADGMTCFQVEGIPEVSVGERLLFHPEEKRFYTVVRSPIDAEAVEAARERAKTRASAKKAMDRVLQWLAENDWKVNKHTLGEWADDDPRWLEYLEGREKARAEYDAAVAALEVT